ncbi:hypothetical protein V9T40_009132 [Parthenolecanium corni]|uniref:Uncharacterized protein n=1 Tax=Parthenolecanium corni TaxID=536013 RepID=A0AAN9TPB0_9HEMI
MTRNLHLACIAALLCSICVSPLETATSTTKASTSKSKATTITTTKATTIAQTTTKATTITTSTTTQRTASPSTSTTIPSQNTSKTLESNDLAAAATAHKSPKRAVPGFTENFSTCKRSSPEFDKCIRDGLNKIREFIPKGVSEYNIPSFDPIYIKEVLLKRGGPAFGYRLKLKNVRESGWRLSEVTKFKSNLRLNTVQLTQYFPDKHLEGEYEFESLILSPSSNKGQFNLSLYELNQTTTLTKPRNSKSIKVNVDVQEIGDMKLHISNLLRGRTRMGKLELKIILDTIS